MGRADDPDLAEKMKAEAEGIFLWAFEGLQLSGLNNLETMQTVSGQFSRGHRSDRIPPRRAHGTLQPIGMKVSL